jgi:hypothetical protein
MKDGSISRLVLATIILFFTQSTTDISVKEDKRAAKFSLAEQIEGTYVRKPKK